MFQSANSSSLTDRQQPTKNKTHSSYLFQQVAVYFIYDV
ncbi:hypothetical protein RV17_GL000270 [Enterococcus thailandicus]|nr:hypothetical protein RV17_GL000270 [Enterococcus thailandicus]